MAAFDVVETKVMFDAPLGLGRAFIGLEVNLFILEASPEALDEDVVDPTAFPVHTGEIVKCCV
jgi:hypothetical protein